MVFGAIVCVIYFFICYISPLNWGYPLKSSTINHAFHKVGQDKSLSIGEPWSHPYSILSIPAMLTCDQGTIQECWPGGINKVYFYLLLQPNNHYVFQNPEGQKLNGKP